MAACPGDEGYAALILPDTLASPITSSRTVGVAVPIPMFPAGATISPPKVALLFSKLRISGHLPLYCSHVVLQVPFPRRKCMVFPFT